MFQTCEWHAQALHKICKPGPISILSLPNVLVFPTTGIHTNRYPHQLFRSFSFQFFSKNFKFQLARAGAGTARRTGRLGGPSPGQLEIEIFKWVFSCLHGPSENMFEGFTSRPHGPTENIFEGFLAVPKKSIWLDS